MSILDEMGPKYIWWKTGYSGAFLQRRIVAQVMDIGDYGDVLRVLDELGEDPFRDVLTHAEAGWLNARSWSYWHYRLGLVPPGEPVPPLPHRTFQ